MRIGILGIQHESNTFYPEPTEFRHFHNGIFVRGDEIRRKYEKAHHEVSGFLEGLEREGLDAVPLLMTFAMPGGTVSDEALDSIWAIATEELDKVGSLDGLLVAPHGAAVNHSRPDMDGWWLGELRKRVGPDLPIIAVIDPHANFSPAMAANCNAVIAYRENPHVDQKQRGLEAAHLMARTLRGEVKPVLAASFPAVAMNIECHSTLEKPMLSVSRELERVRALEGVLSVSVMMGYPYADVSEMGSSFVVVTNKDEILAERLARELADWLVAKRSLFKGCLIPPEQALHDAALSPKPVALFDMGDNLGGGAPADSTMLARLFHQLRPVAKAFVCLLDPESVQQAENAGIDATTVLSMGGKSPMSPSPPFEAEVTVRCLHDGKYHEDQPRHGGLAEFDMGRTAVVTTHSGLTIMLTSRATLPASVNQLLCCGLVPSDFDLLILKGVHAPVAAYKEICRTMIRANTPGVTTADMEKLPYTRRRKPLFPFEES
jgi:microcystin degradation protein MlrC